MCCLKYTHFSPIFFPVSNDFFPQLLQKRYQQAKSGSPLTSIKERVEVLEVLQEWIQRGSGGEDALDDSQFYDTFKAFNSELTREVPFSSSPRDSMDVKIKEAWKALTQAKESLTALFTAHTKRPPIKKPCREFHDISGEGRSPNSDLPDIDRLSPEELVNVIDAMINAAFRNVTEEVSIGDYNSTGRSANVITGHPCRL